jgi:pyruvate/2-oxoglutarate dehydrogenase complex dihydrolipoamide dehydrogenase (E3) component
MLNGERFTSRKTLVATGSYPLVPQIEGLEETGYVTNEHVFDLTRRPSSLLVIGVYLFTHVAAYQAGVAVRIALVPIAKKKVDYRVVPWCTFTDPEVAHVGLTPEEANQQHKQVRIMTFPWAEIDRAQAEHATTGFIKLVLAWKKDELVGVHMIDASAGELSGEISLAMQHHLGLNDILATVHAYLTMNTGIQQAAFEAYLAGAAVKNHRKIVRTVLSLRRR